MCYQPSTLFWYLVHINIPTLNIEISVKCSDLDLKKYVVSTFHPLGHSNQN